jgi:hypothetical protein
LTEGCCSRNDVQLLEVEKIDDFVELYQSNKALIVCDLSGISIDELRLLVKEARDIHAKILGFYPHISNQIGAEAKKEGIDFATPRSGFGAKLNSILK